MKYSEIQTTAARNTKLIAALQEMGYDISEEELRNIQPNDYIGKPVIARALIAKGYEMCIRDRSYRRKIPQVHMISRRTEAQPA